MSLPSSQGWGNYYDRIHQDIIDVVPTSAKCVLSVGCAAGASEEEIVKRGVKVVGIELDPTAAAIARQRGLIVLQGDVSEIDISKVNEFFDCLIYADILEHLPNPAAVIRQHVTRLLPDGIVYISVPNFRRYSVFWQLFVRGRVDYVDGGILDCTHLRITTRKMVEQWFYSAGIKVMDCRYKIQGVRDKLISACLLGLAKEFVALQVCLVGSKRRLQENY
jgi:2-polyprenyl-3-methyl-5-hydroxy-6-metoxy-1,4-benzoquinol methylase